MNETLEPMTARLNGVAGPWRLVEGSFQCNELPVLGRLKQRDFGFSDVKHFFEALARALDKCPDIPVRTEMLEQPRFELERRAHETVILFHSDPDNYSYVSELCHVYHVGLGRYVVDFLNMVAK